MKKTHIFSLVLIAGVLGYLLRLWLYGAMDSACLLPEFHIASILLLLLGVLSLLTLFMLCRSTGKSLSYSAVFPAGIDSTIGCIAAAAGFLMVALPRQWNAISIIHCILCVCAAVSMGMIAFCRLEKKTPNMLFPAVVTVSFLIHLIGLSHVWGSVPQIQQYLPPMLACLFLMLTAYYQTEMVVDTRHAGRYLLCSGSAMFFCLVAMNVEPFYLPMAVWCASEVIRFREG